MNNFKKLGEFFAYKNQLVKDILTHESIYKLIDEDTTEETAINLAYTQVFPYEYIPETITEGKTYVCCDVDINKTANKTFLFPIMYIWVFTHKSKLRLPQGGVRTDMICSEIDDVINGSRYYGLGELDLTSVSRFAPLEDFQGKVMVYTADDFNRLHGGNVSVPSNRRLGK